MRWWQLLLELKNKAYMAIENTYMVSDKVAHKRYGVGEVEAINKVEKPSDGDPTVYAVRYADGSLRNHKSAELKPARGATE